MFCNWGGPGWFHFGGWMVWPFLLLFVGAGLLLLLRGRKASCAACNGAVAPVYLRCPHCGATLKGHCPECSGIVESNWKYCPHCQAELGKGRN